MNDQSGPAHKPAPRSGLPRAPVVVDRVRAIAGQSFAFVPHRFLREGFFASLSAEELRLYFLLVLVADRHGGSFYHYDSICSLLQVPLDTYLQARNGLIRKDLIAFDGTRFQVLSLPQRPVVEPVAALATGEDFEAHDRATIKASIHRSLAAAPTDRERGPR